MRSLVRLIELLDERGYDFVTVTPATQARVLANRGAVLARDLRDVFGWSLPFREGLLDPSLLGCLQEADALETAEEGYRSRLRASRLHGRLFLHSAYPTDSPEAVFLGPDSYRFADFLRADLTADPATGDLLDIGAGAGVGALVAAPCMRARRVVLTDVNPASLRLAKANAAAAGAPVQCLLGDDARAAPGYFDVIVANPPFIADDVNQLAYRHGGGAHGAGASLTFTTQALSKLAPQGRFLLYTGSAIVGGEDRLHGRLAALAEAQHCEMTYREIDPDIFGEELCGPAYRDVERICAVGARFTRRG